MKKEVEDFVGKKATVDVGGMNVEVKIIDIKNSYGRTRYSIIPVAGTLNRKEVWTEKVTLLK